MKKRARDIEIFSLSSIDLFAAAMGAFALLTIVLLPYYQKEIVQRTPDNAIADLLREIEATDTAGQITGIPSGVAFDALSLGDGTTAGNKLGNVCAIRRDNGDWEP